MLRFKTLVCKWSSSASIKQRLRRRRRYVGDAVQEIDGQDRDEIDRTGWDHVRYGRTYMARRRQTMTMS